MDIELCGSLQFCRLLLFVDEWLGLLRGSVAVRCLFFSKYWNEDYYCSAGYCMEGRRD